MNAEKAEIETLPEEEFRHIWERMSAKEYIDEFFDSLALCWHSFYRYDSQSGVEEQAVIVHAVVRGLGQMLQAWPVASVKRDQGRVWSHIVKLTSFRPPVDAKQVYAWLDKGRQETMVFLTYEERKEQKKGEV